MGFHGEHIAIGQSRIAVSIAPPLSDAAWISPFPIYAEWSTLLAASVADEVDPMLRWRARLLRAGVPDDPSRPPAAIEDGPVEALALQEELRWRAALSRLHRIDPALCARVRSCLLPVVRNVETGIMLPLWVTDPRPLEPLLDALLDERATPTITRSRVESWIRRQPDTVVWVEQAFAEPVPGSSFAMARAWAGNASERPLLAWISPQADRALGWAVPEPRLLEPGELAVLEAPTSSNAPAGTRTLEIHIGARTERAEVVVDALPAMPPGVRLGPLIPASDAATVLGASTGPQSPSVAWSGLLRRLDPVGLHAGPLATRTRWSILIESTWTPAHAAARLGDSLVTLDFAHDGGRTRVAVRADGTITLAAPPGLPTSGYPNRVPVSSTPSGWMAEVPVPDWCVGLDGFLRLGVTAAGSDGHAWSWPSPMLRHAPDRVGRAVIDLDAWDRGGPAGPRSLVPDANPMAGIP